MNKTYCFTDLHGNYELWRQIRNYCDETDTLIFLGDAIDRGPAGIKIMLEMLKDSRVIYLKGNHEEFLQKCGEVYFRNPDRANSLLWQMNGGNPTYQDFIKLAEEEQRFLIEKVQQMPETYIYHTPDGKEIYLSHSGVYIEPKYFEFIDYPGENPFTWDREHLYLPWPQEEEFKNKYVVHGHTPMQHVAAKIFEPLTTIYQPFVYADGHKICLDTGCFATDVIILFDLDTLTREKAFSLSKEKTI